MPRTRAAVLGATADLLAEVGYEELTVEAVARRAGVHKTTVYRRWPTKPDLVADAARERSVQLVEVPDTGSLRGDLTALGAGGRRQHRLRGRRRDDEDARCRRGHVAVGRRGHARVLGRTAPAHRRDRRTARSGAASCRLDVDANLVIESLVGALYVRLLLTGEPLDDDVADQVAGTVASGFAVPT